MSNKKTTTGEAANVSDLDKKTNNSLPVPFLSDKKRLILIGCWGACKDEDFDSITSMRTSINNNFEKRGNV